MVGAKLLEMHSATTLSTLGTLRLSCGLSRRQLNSGVLGYTLPAASTIYHLRSAVQRAAVLYFVRCVWQEARQINVINVR